MRPFTFKFLRINYTAYTTSTVNNKDKCYKSQTVATTDSRYRLATWKDPTDELQRVQGMVAITEFREVGFAAFVPVVKGSIGKTCHLVGF